MNIHSDYQNNIVPEWQKEFKLVSSLAVPKINKVVINIGLKEAKDDKKIIEIVSDQLKAITAQQPKLCRAKKSIAGFKLGRNQPIGLMVTLRGRRADAFLDKLVNIVLPRVRDFSGLSKKSFDSKGNYSLGINEQIVFPEIDFSKIDKSRGLQVTINTNAHNPKTGFLLLSRLGFPFEKGE